MDSEGNWSLDDSGWFRGKNSMQTGTWGESLMLDKIGKTPDPLMVTRRYGRT